MTKIARPFSGTILKIKSEELKFGETIRENQGNIKLISLLDSFVMTLAESEIENLKHIIFVVLPEEFRPIKEYKEKIFLYPLNYSLTPSLLRFNTIPIVVPLEILSGFETIRREINISKFPIYIQKYFIQKRLVGYQYHKKAGGHCATNWDTTPPEIPFVEGVEHKFIVSSIISAAYTLCSHCGSTLTFRSDVEVAVTNENKFTIVCSDCDHKSTFELNFCMCTTDLLPYNNSTYSNSPLAYPRICRLISNE